MKKNDFATIIAYALMIGVAIMMGLLVIKPILEQYGATINSSINSILLIVLSLVAGIILNALLVELLHLAGAKAGKYEIYSFVILGIGMKKTKEKKKFGFHSFEGLTGETKVRPLDPKTSSLGLFVFLPILGLIVEVITLMILHNVASKNGGSMAWLSVMCLTILAVTAMVFIYDLFPARLDTDNDGFLLMLLTKPANKYAYNNILEQEYCKKFELPTPAPVVYDDITEFTAGLNIVSVANLIVEGKSKEAEDILNIHLNPEIHVPSSVHNEAMAYKLALLLERKDKNAGKKYYDELTDNERSYIASMTTMAALRCYILISAFVENSENECNYAIDKVSQVLKHTDKDILEAEKSIVDSEVKEVRTVHISWDVYPLPWEEQDVFAGIEQPEEEEEEPKEDNPSEDKKE